MKRHMLLIPLIFLLTLLPAQSTVTATTTDLFISEYIEGSSYNKAIEIYNGTGSEIDLSAYTLELYSNGASSASQSVALSGSLSDGDVLVLAHKDADPAILANTDIVNSTVINFNGDDALVLKKEGTIVDVFGQVGYDPGSYWGSGDVTTKDHTLRRLDSVCSGDTVPDDAFDPALEWAGFAINTFDGLGSHTADCNGVTDYAPYVLDTTPADAAVDVPRDADIVITFSEAVSVSEDWFDITCSNSGSHAAEVSGGPEIFTLNPGDDFTYGETCDVDIYAAGVIDQDDLPDAMAADFILSFSIEEEVVVSPPEIIITEIMYDSNSAESDWEWIEIYNAGSSAVDLAGFVVDDFNTVSLSAANISSGILAVGEQAVLYNVDEVSAADFQAAWGTVNLIPVTNWSALGLNNSGDQVSLWDSFASYSGDNTAHANAIDTVNYGGSGFPDPVGKSIYLTDLSADNNLGENWAISSDGGITPLYTGYTSEEAGGNTGEDIGSPGIPYVAPLEVVINEFSASTTGTDVEYVEIYGSPGMDFSSYAILEIEGDSTSNRGTVDEVISLGTTDADGFYLASLPANALENGTITLLLVQNFSGTFGEDLDTDDDGVFDVMPWEAVIDAVAVNDGGSSDQTYGIPVLDPGYDGVSYYAPGGASRIPDGMDTDTAADWVRNDFDLAGIPGYVGSLVTGEALNTPGINNQIYVAPETCGDPYTSIYAVQGSGPISPKDGMEVAVEGIVVGDFQNNASADNGDLDGFHIQDPTGDGDPATSDGIFIYAPSGMDVQVGDAVRVRGYVSEYYDMTEITASQIWVCSEGNSVTPTALSLPVTSGDDFEAYEGMLVTFPQALVISEYYEFDRYGEIVLTSERHLSPTAEHEPGPDAIEAAAEIELDRITLDDGRTIQNPDPAIHPNGNVFDLTNLFRGGDTVQNVTGVMDYSFGLYRIQPTQGADYASANPRPEQPDEIGGSLTVASFNVLNYFSTIDTGADICGPSEDLECRGADSDEEFTRQRDKIIKAISTTGADILGLIEIENHINDDAVKDLVAGLNDLNGPGTYAYVPTGPIGEDAIKVAFIYKPASVSLVGDYAVLDSSVDSRFIDTKNRPSLAQTFMDNTTGGILTVVVNHLKSKGSDCDDLGDYDLGDGAGNCNLTRTAAAEALVDWLLTDPTGSGDADFLIIGDLNAYDKEDPIDALLLGGYEDLVLYYNGEDAYSYVFDGQIGYLDHALARANSSLYEDISGVTVWHINADEPDLIDYDLDFKQSAQAAIYSADPFRSSDHDPVLIGMDICDEIAPTLDIDLSHDILWPANHKYVDVTAVVTASDNFDTNPVVTLVSVTSSELDDAPGGGDGKTVDDIVIVDDYTFQLRAERSATNKYGRIYTITYQVEDACGNVTLETATVIVPFNQRMIW